MAKFQINKNDNIKKNNALFVFTRTPWSEPERARHQVAKALALYSSVVFIEANKIGYPRIELKEISENLQLLTPFWPIDYRIRFRLPIINELFQLWLVNKVRNLVGKRNVQLINFDHSAQIINEKLGNQPIYYCNDNHVRSHGLPLVKKYFEYTEKKVSQTSGLIICTTDWLTNKFKKYNKNVITVSLGALTPSIVPIFNNKSPKNKIKVLLVGFVSSQKVPIDTLVKILSVKDVTLNIVGPVEANISSDLCIYDNYHESGVLKGKKLEEAINNSHVCIAIYDPKNINKGMSPNKLWQYLAFGKPVVLTNIPNFKQEGFCEKLIYMTDNENILDKIYDAFQEDNYALFKQRLRLANKNSWNSKVKHITEYFNISSIDETTDSKA